VPKGTGIADALLAVEAVRDRPSVARRNGPELGVRAEGVHGHDLLADLEMRHFGADLDDLARRLVADDVRPGHQRPAPAVQGVAALDGDGQHADDDALGVADGVRDILVLQDFRGSVLVVDGGFHGGSGFLFLLPEGEGGARPPKPMAKRMGG